MSNRRGMSCHSDDAPVAYGHVYWWIMGVPHPTPESAARRLRAAGEDADAIMGRVYGPAGRWVPTPVWTAIGLVEFRPEVRQ